MRVPFRSNTRKYFRGATSMSKAGGGDKTMLSATSTSSSDASPPDSMDSSQALPTYSDASSSEFSADERIINYVSNKTQQ